MSIPKDYDTGAPKGYVLILFLYSCDTSDSNCVVNGLVPIVLLMVLLWLTIIVFINIRMAYMDFTDADALNKALEFDNSDLGNGCYLSVQPAKPRGDFTGERPSRGRRGGGRFDSGGRRGGGRFDSGGRRGGRDSGGRRGGRGGRGPSLATPGTGQYH